jgi:1-acyl-sn-glycerol-3-phosphate acyltransferase
LSNALFSICYWIFLVANCIVLFVGAFLLWAITKPFDRNLRILHYYTCWWGAFNIRTIPGCPIVIEGREKIVPGMPYVFVVNHQSMTDILALCALAVPFKWVSKKEVYRLPLIGWNMSLNGYVSVDRGNLRDVAKTMAVCRRWLERGIPLMMFPEGHRSPDGEIHKFHPGAFKLAADCKCPVLPIVVDGTWPIYRGWRVKAFPGRVTIRVLDPLTLESAGGSVTKLRDTAFERMQEDLARIRGRTVQLPKASA